MQATVFDFDERDGGGTVVLDSGERVRFEPSAFAASGLRFLRPGQRVRIDLSPDGTVETVTIATLPDSRLMKRAPAVPRRDDRSS